MRTILNFMIAGVMAAAAGGATGCYAEDNVAYGGEVAYDGSPDLVEVSPGVQVIADYDEPVFFTDGYYWRFSGGYWYSSGRWGGGWGRVDRPPVAIGRIDRPGAYAHYRPTGWHPRAARGREPARRDVRNEVRRGEPTRPNEVRRSEPARAPSAPSRAPSHSSSSGHKK